MTTDTVLVTVADVDALYAFFKRLAFEKALANVRALPEFTSVAGIVTRLAGQPRRG